MDEKQLIVAVEGAAAVGPHWKTIVSDYIDKILRSFSGNDSLGQRPTAPSLRLGLVVFYTHDPYNACLVQRSGWTRDIDIFLQWLSAISFGGGGSNDSAIVEGLNEALMMLCPPEENKKQVNVEGQKHCILVAASNPASLPTPVFKPQLFKMEQAESTEQADNRLSDAETIAKSFGLCSVSLSVISPKQLPKLEAIFNAGKCNPQTDPPIVIAKNPSFLVLISEDLMDGRSALSRSGMQNVAETQSPVNMDVTSAQPVSVPLSTSIPTANGSIHPVTVGNIPPATVEVEPPTVTSMAGPVFPHMSSVPHPATPAVASVHTSSPMFSSKDMMSPPESLQDMKPTVSTLPSTHMGQSGTSMSQNMLSGIGASGMPSVTAAMMPTPATPQPQQTGTQELGVTNNTSECMAQQNEATLQAKPKYVLAWVGNLFGQRRGQSVFVTRLEGYIRSSTSESLVANWPESIQIQRLISQDHIHSKKYGEKADLIVFRAMNHHGFIDQVLEKKLCAVIQLPGQILLLAPSDKAFRLIGMILPSDMCVYRPLVSKEQKEQQMLQQNQQLQPRQEEQSVPQLQQQPYISQVQQQQQLNQLQAAARTYVAYAATTPYAAGPETAERSASTETINASVASTSASTYGWSNKRSDFHATNGSRTRRSKR